MRNGCTHKEWLWNKTRTWKRIENIILILCIYMYKGLIHMIQRYAHTLLCTWWQRGYSRIQLLTSVELTRGKPVNKKKKQNSSIKRRKLTTNATIWLTTYIYTWWTWLQSHKEKRNWYLCTDSWEEHKRLEPSWFRWLWKHRLPKNSTEDASRNLGWRRILCWGHTASMERLAVVAPGVPCTIAMPKLQPNRPNTTGVSKL